MSSVTREFDWEAADRERHHPGAVINRIGPDFGKQQCDYCVRVWPCDASRFRDLADELRQVLSMVHSAVHCAEPCDAVMHDDVVAALAKLEASK